MSSTRSLSGKVAVVTGAAGGVGSATARALAAKRARVALGDLDGEAAERVAAEIGGAAVGLPLDVTDSAGFTAFLDEVEQRLGPLDILINNAGVMPVSLFDEESDAVTRLEVEVNLYAVMHGTKQAIKRMKPRRNGHIVNIASGGGWMASGGGATYCGTKFGVVGFSEAVSLELHGTGVNISVVGPTVVKTQLSAGIKEVRGASSVTPEQVADAIVAGLERPRFAIFVPRSLGGLAFTLSATPYRVRHFLARLIHTDKLLLNYDKDVRAPYEARVAQEAEAIAGSIERVH
jgi:short-subunit dehydrogenase